MTDFYDEDFQQPTRPTLKETLEALTGGAQGTISATVFYGLSDLNPSDLAQVKQVWETLDADYRSKVMRRLVDVSESNFELDYRAIGALGLRDADSEVRQAAIDVLWEDQSLELMSDLIALTLRDEALPVRAAAMSALGRFILLGELGDLPERETIRAQQAAVSILNDKDEPIEVRRRALEAISNSSHEIVVSAINEAYHGSDQRMRVSALYAMGRSCDEERWSGIVLKEMQSTDPEMRFEAARAAGELELAAAVPILARLAEESDREIKEVAIWSLGEIGGKKAMKVLNRLADEAEAEDADDLLSVIEDAMGNASLVDGELFF